jgi:hypothetical protein
MEKLRTNPITDAEANQIMNQVSYHWSNASTSGISPFHMMKPAATNQTEMISQHGAKSTVTSAQPVFHVNPRKGRPVC